jgi:hypothetical protein
MPAAEATGVRTGEATAKPVGMRTAESASSAMESTASAMEAATAPMKTSASMDTGEERFRRQSERDRYAEEKNSQNTRPIHLVLHGCATCHRQPPSLL